MLWFCFEGIPDLPAPLCKQLIATHDGAGSSRALPVVVFPSSPRDAIPPDEIECMLFALHRAGHLDRRQFVHLTFDPFGDFATEGYRDRS